MIEQEHSKTHVVIFKIISLIMRVDFSLGDERSHSIRTDDEQGQVHRANGLSVPGGSKDCCSQKTTM